MLNVFLNAYILRCIIGNVELYDSSDAEWYLMNPRSTTTVVASLVRLNFVWSNLF